MHRFSRFTGAFTAIAAVSVLTMAGCGSGAESAGGAGSTPTTAQCGGLAEKLVPLRGAASGNTFTDLVATNNGTTACTLPAQPDLQYLDAHSQPLAVAFSSDPQLKPYTLAPGASAAMVIGYGSDGDGVCVAIAAVRVTPPGKDLPDTGRSHCAHDTAYEEGWAAGTYSAPH